MTDFWKEVQLRRVAVVAMVMLFITSSAFGQLKAPFTEEEYGGNWNEPVTSFR